MNSRVVKINSAKTVSFRPVDRGNLFRENPCPRKFLCPLSNHLILKEKFWKWKQDIFRKRPTYLDSLSCYDEWNIWTGLESFPEQEQQPAKLHKNDLAYLKTWKKVGYLSCMSFPPTFILKMQEPWRVFSLQWSFLTE